MITNIISFDLGRRSLGIAISRSGFLVSLLENLKFEDKDYDTCIKKLKEVIRFERIEHIVIGLPLYPSGDECEMTPIVKAFVDERLRPMFPNVDINFVDERESTLEAASILHGNNLNSKKQKSMIDSAAAGVILERYLRQIGQL